jgi:hypothetical protein
MILVDQTKPYLVKRLKESAKDVLMMAASGGMPDSFWMTDKRIERACATLKWTPEKAREWAQTNAPRRGL